jgi:imidazolonepropionase-like amidohydrolase/Tol biopolymer transport system component
LHKNCLCRKVSHAKTQSAAAFLRVFLRAFAPLREKCFLSRAKYLQRFASLRLCARKSSAVLPRSQMAMLPTLSRQLKLCIDVSILASICLSPLSAQTSPRGPSETITIRVSEGTTLGFDISPDGRSIVMDLLGQLWLVPARGGTARPITNAVRDAAEDLDPSFSPDGRRLVFRGERNGRTGLWLLTLDGSSPRQLTQLSNPDGYEGDAAWSPDGKTVAFTRAMPPDLSNNSGRMTIELLDVDSGATRNLSITGLQNPSVSDPTWVNGGKHIVFVTRMPQTTRGGQIWIVSATGGQARPVTEESVRALFPTFTSDGRFMAYFAPDVDGRMQVWKHEVSGANTAVQTPTRMTRHADVTPTRIRWMGDSLLYSADGRLWKIAAAGGPPVEIHFTASLSITRQKRTLPSARFPEPGRQQPARGFMGLALSPEGRRIGILALGKLWIVPLSGSPYAVTTVPFEATALAWSPDGTEVAWSAGAADQEDLFATNLKTGSTRRVTALPGREAYPAYSPDGRYLAFVHAQSDGVLRVVDAHTSTVTNQEQTRSLGSIGLTWTTPPQWSPESDGLLVSGEARVNQHTTATFVPLSGERKTLTRFPDAPIFLRWTRQNTIVFVRHDRLWQAQFDHNGMLAEPQAIGTSAALYLSSADDGTLLFVSDGGLRLRSRGGRERSLGWPISYTPPVAARTLIRNVRIVDGAGAPITGPRDILVENGRIKRIAESGSLSHTGVRVIEGGNRIVIPGLIDLHAHTYRPDLLPGFVYFGTTTIRDQGSAMAPLVAYADAIAAGSLPGPRVAYGGFQFYSDWPFDEEQGRGIEPEADADHIERAVALAQSFGAQHIKTRTFRRWDINSRMIAEAHRRGMRATGHCSHLLPLIAAGMDAKEHIGVCEPRGNTSVYDDLIQLLRAAGIGVVPTITYFDFAVRVNERPALLDDDAELMPFVPARENFGWMINLKAAAREEWTQMAAQARAVTRKLSRAGVTIGTGTDIWQIPNGVHMELEQLVAAGLSPMEAIHAATGGAAQILGADKEVGTIEPGKWADLVFLDADPLSDIRNTRRIWNVMHNGRIIDRSALVKTFQPR